MLRLADQKGQAGEEKKVPFYFVGNSFAVDQAAARGHQNFSEFRYFLARIFFPPTLFMIPPHIISLLFLRESKELHFSPARLLLLYSLANWAEKTLNS